MTRLCKIARSSVGRSVARIVGLVAMLACAATGMLATQAAETGPAAGKDAFALADKIIREHRLLTPKQIECMTLMERDDSTETVAKIGVYERHDTKCGGDPEITHRLFDLEIDRKTGAAYWDYNFPDMEMRPVPPARQMHERSGTSDSGSRLAGDGCHMPVAS